MAACRAPSLLIAQGYTRSPRRDQIASRRRASTTFPKELSAYQFVELYEDEAVKLEPHIANKVRMKRRYLVGGAAIADGLNPGFPLSPYDLMTDYYAASICSIEGHTLITVASQLAEYRKMRCCEVVDLGTWAAGRQ
jgi:hypothetical protein